MRTPSYLTIIIISFSFFGIGQTKIVLFDSISNEPVINAHVFDKTNVLIALSNEIGEVIFQNQEFPLIIKSFNHTALNIFSISDTIYLEPKIRQLEDVVIKPIDIPTLYQEIITKSNNKAISDINNYIGGTYIESVLIIDLGNRDSICLTKVCDLNILKILDSKTIEYKLIPNYGQKTYWTNSEKTTFDTVTAQKWTNIIPKFNSLLKMDLSSSSKFKINFKNREIKRVENSFELKNNGSNNTETHEIEYIEDLLSSWKNTNMIECSSENNIAMCFSKTSQTLQFNIDSNGYFLSNCYLDGIINFQINDKKYEIKLMKGFIENQEAIKMDGVEYANIEDYFGTMSFSENKSLANLYKFSK